MRSPALTSTIARFQVGSTVWRRVPRIVRRPPFMLTVRTAEYDGRLRKYYHITQAGLARLDAFRKEWEEMVSVYRFVTKEENRHE